MKLVRKAGATSNILQIFVRDSTSTTGAGLTGLVFNSASLTAYYHRDTDTTATVITLVTMTVGTFTSSGFKEIDATNMPGWYQFCPPDAAIAAAAKSCGFHLKGAASMAPLPIEVQLVAYDPDDAVRLGLTALPNAAAEAAGGLYTRGTGAGQINQANNGQVDTNAARLGGTTQTGRDVGASVLLSSGTGTGQLDFTSGIVKSNLSQILGTALTETAGLIAAGFKKFFNVATPTGTVNSLPDAVAGAAGGIFIAGSNAATTANITGNITGNLSGSVGSVTAGVTVTTNNDKTGYGLSAAAVQAIWDALTSALTTVGSIGKLLVDNITGNSFTRLGAPVGASISADIAAVKAQVVVINADTDDIQTRLPAALVSGRMDSSVGSYPGNTAQTGDSFARLGAPVGASISADIAAVQADTDNLQTRVPAALVSGRMDSSVGAVAADAITAAGIAAGAIDRATFAADTGLVSIRSNTAQAGAAGSITLDAGASAVDNFYVGLRVLLTGATGAGQVRTITAYVGATKVATVDWNWVTNPDSSSTFALMEADGPAVNSSLQVATTASDPWSTALPGAYGGGTAGFIVGTNVDALISSRTKPADTQAAVTTVTNLTNAPTAGDFTAVMKTSLNAATPAVTVSDKTGFSLSAAGIQAIWDRLTSALTTVGSIGKLLVDNINATIASRAATGAQMDLVNAPNATAITAIQSGLATSSALTTVASNVTAIKAKTDNLPAAPAAVGDIPTANQNADALLDRSAGIETGLTPRQALRVIASSSAGKLSGAATTTVIIRNAQADSKDRITATVDADGNRSAVVLDVS